MSLASLSVPVANAVSPLFWPAAVPSDPTKPTATTRLGFEILTRYIPTETVTLYVAAMAAREQIATAFGLGVLDAVTLIYATFAALTGYLVWALSVPGHPVADQLAGLPALGALVVSTFLSLLDPLFAPTVKSQERPK